MLTRRWSKKSPPNLVFHILPEAVHLIDPAIDIGDPPIKGKIKAIYNRLRKYKIEYSKEPFNPNEPEVQEIRHPIGLVGPPKHGTCIDLTLLFCGLCMHYELLPLIVVLEDHALALVSIQPGIGPGKRKHAERRNHTLFERGWLERGTFSELRELIEKPSGSGAPLPPSLQSKSAAVYVPVECIGFTSQHDLDFETAVEQGYDRIIKGEFCYALDVVTLRYDHLFDSYAEDVNLITSQLPLKSSKDPGRLLAQIAQERSCILIQIEKALYNQALEEQLAELKKDDRIMQSAHRNHLLDQSRRSGALLDKSWPPKSLRQSISLYFYKVVLAKDALYETYERYSALFPQKPDWFDALKAEQATLGDLANISIEDASANNQYVLYSTLVNINQIIYSQTNLLNKTLSELWRLPLSNLLDKLASIDFVSDLSEEYRVVYMQSLDRLRKANESQHAFLLEHGAWAKLEKSLQAIETQISMDPRFLEAHARTLTKLVSPVCTEFKEEAICKSCEALTEELNRKKPTPKRVDLKRDALLLSLCTALINDTRGRLNEINRSAALHCQGVRAILLPLAAHPAE